MTNYEKFISMTVKEFAKTRIQWDGDFGGYINDTNNYYGGNDEDLEKAVQDEINWLNEEVKG